jgi:hypothetical protein
MKKMIISEEEKNRILEMHKSPTKKGYLKEQQDLANESILQECAYKLYKIEGDENNPQSTGIPFLDMIAEACRDFIKTDDWDEEKIVEALEFGSPNDVKKSQEILRCFFKSARWGAFPLQDNNPLLTIARKAFTTMGMTDLGDKELKMRAQKALSRFGIKTKI